MVLLSLRMKVVILLHNVYMFLCVVCVELMGYA